MSHYLLPIRSCSTAAEIGKDQQLEKVLILPVFLSNGCARLLTVTLGAHPLGDIRIGLVSWE